jgi:integrase
LDEVLAVTAVEKSPGTTRSYSLAARNFIGILSDMPLEQLTSKHVSDFKIRRMQTVSPASVNVDLAALKAMFTVLMQWEWLVKNPFLNVKLVRIPETETQFLTEEMIRTVLASMTNEHLKQVVTFAYYTGCRLNEILHIKWGDIDWANARIIVRNTASFTTKSRKNRTLPLHPDLGKLLQGISRYGVGEYVFCNKAGEMLRSDTISHQFKRALRQNKMSEALHFHSLRHSFASILVQKGTPIYQVSKLLGHSSVKVTERYAHLYAEDGGKYVDQINIGVAVSDK